MDCLGTYFTHVQACTVTRVHSATEWTASECAEKKGLLRRALTGRWTVVFYYLYVVYMYEVVHIQVDAPIFICIGYKLNNRVLCFANIVFLNIWIYSLIPYRMANLWAWYQQSLPGLYIVGLSCENSPFVLMGCSENDLQGPSKIKQNSQGEMNFKGYHDVVASSLAAPSVGGAVHPGCGDMFQHCNHDHEKPDVDERWHSTCYVTLLRKHRCCHIYSFQMSACFRSFPSIRSLWKHHSIRSPWGNALAPSPMVMPN